MRFQSATEKRAKDYAALHGFTVRRIPHSLEHPNGYVRVTTPKGTQMKARDMSGAMDVMMSYVIKHKRGGRRNG